MTKETAERIITLERQLEKAQEQLRKYEDTLRLYNRLICALND